MNENFKQLGIRAKLMFLTDREGNAVGITPEQLEAYSRMIVSKCAEIVSSDPYFASFAAKEICDHFGIK